MLNIDMKRKINTLRDILVGRIPDPKTQVEQITLAMIFKFMDDIDTEFTGEWGGERTFFVKTDKMDYSKYAWSNIMSPQVSGEERSNLYREGIENMAMNPHIPQLFRDIFRNAYLPFRDPETVNMFLKEIDDLKYDNSEDLGNAFEMLLSIMGSQGDAGQFRTPRHIIDMIVEIVDPAKTDSILDPACGTAGFLISAYKHILNRNKDKNGNSTLAPDERNLLTTNITGYDISPDMVRLSNVNLYLHHFPEPHIHIYDTLTSEARWDNTYDVILANPPFMTPKGGINPHNRFRVNARRSEVLFVDYIAEHLNPNGKAGIIVPEGIVFQTSNAYKELRKMLIEDNYLYAVISLPAGVFNPYSGVKTSILLFDRTIAKQTDNILFVKIDNDGFDLGAQRKEIKENDISRTIEVMQKYKKVVIAGETIEPEEFENDYTILASKKEIIEKDCVLVGERYREIAHNHNIKWDMVELGEICKTSSGGTPLSSKNEYYENGTIPWLTSGEVNNGYIYSTKSKITELGLNNSSAKMFPINTVIIAMYGATAGQVGILKTEASTNQAVCGIYPSDKYIPDFLYWVLKSLKSRMVALTAGGAQPNISQKIIRSLKIPLPPLSIQQEIVNEIESYQKIIDGARQVVENYKPLIKIDPAWEMVGLGEVCEFKYGKPLKQEDRIEGEYPVYGSNGVVGYHNKYLVQAPFIVVGRKGSAGKVVFSKNNGNPIDTTFYIDELKKDYNLEFLYYILLNLNLDKVETQSGVPGLNRNNAYEKTIPLPDIDTQNIIVDKIKKEEYIVQSNKTLIEIFEQKIKDKIAEVWGE